MFQTGLFNDPSKNGYANAIIYDWQFSGDNEEYLDPARYQYDEFFVFFFQAEDGIRDSSVTGVQTCALPISHFGRLRNGMFEVRTTSMRTNRLALCLLTVCLAAGCLSSQRKPFVNNPLLLYYKPTLSDSATILAEQAARREPAQPPMPGFAREIAPTSP